MRVFAVDNVSEVQVLAATFERPTDFNLDAFGANSVSGVMHSEELTDVTVRFSPIVAKAAALAPASRRRRVERKDDGSAEITYAVSDPTEIVRWAMSWGAEAEVLSPAAARTAARELAAAIAERYGS
jgi:proteasome accessory factor B